MGENIREEIAQRFYDAVFPGADWGEPGEYEKEPFYDRADEMRGFLKSLIEQMENPFEDWIQRYDDYEQCRKDILAKLQAQAPLRGKGDRWRASHPKGQVAERGNPEYNRLRNLWKRNKRTNEHWLLAGKT